jgi:hypothetical protein
MLIAVSIAGGAVYSTVGQECVEDSTGFTGTSVQITNFATSADSNNISLQAENRRSERVEIKRIEFDYGNDSRQTDIVQQLGPYEASDVGVPGFQQSDSCNSIDVEITYDMGPLKNQKVSGSLTADIEFDDTTAPITPDSFNADYPNLS